LAVLLTVASSIAVAISKPAWRRGRAFMLSIVGGVGGLFLGVAAQWLVGGPLYRWGMVPLVFSAAVALLAGFVGARESMARWALRSLPIVAVVAVAWLSWQYTASSSERCVLQMAKSGALSYSTVYATAPNQYPDGRDGERRLLWLRRVLGLAYTESLRTGYRIDWHCFRGLSHLRNLQIYGAGVSDDDLRHLSHLTSLERLELRGIGITADELAKLRAALPGTQISASLVLR
jgi:hypothetical protein